MSRKKLMKFMTGIVLCTMLVSFSACAGKQKELSYDQTLKEAQKEGNMYYSIVQLKEGKPILLVTEQTYDNEIEKQAAFSCEAYTQDNKQIIKADELDGAGTAYPLTADKNGIYVQTGHDLKIYTIDSKTKKLKVDTDYSEDFDKEGNVVYTKSINGKVKKSSDAEFMKELDKISKAKEIHFIKIK